VAVIGRADSEQEVLDLGTFWWLFVLVGAASLVAGCILVAKPSHSLATLAVIVGIFVLLDGIVELIGSFGRGRENRGLSAIIGVIAIVVGLILIRHPTHAVAAIGLLIGIWLVAAGVMRFLRALVASAHPVLQVGLAILEVIVGIVIVAEPHIGYATLAVLLGIWLILNGIGTIGLGIIIRKAREPSGGAAAGGG
jgi:uncharacterized membrane protein HdeD (DUF308 family)